jgi:hypothetical protein
MIQPLPLALALALPALLPQDRDPATWERLAGRFDTNADGRITRDEFPRRAFFFRRLDADRDGMLTPADFGIEEAPSAGMEEGPTAQDPEGLALFEAEIRPIFEESCWECHGAELRRPRGGLRMHTREALLAGGSLGPALRPGDPEGSPLVEAVRYLDDETGMPPEGPLAADQVEAIERWVELGAPWPTGPDRYADESDWAESGIDLEAGREWWSFRPVERPEVPTPEDAAWGLSPVDAFLRVEMEEAGVRPVGDAARSAWLRRVTFDLTGLPPTPEELEAFVADRTPEAAERVVDRLLASPRYAERWGRHWLDVARYAESSGRDSNVVYPHAWRYRDYVLDAFDRDVPYDRFLMEQLAGDLLPAETVDDKARLAIATGYLAIGPKSHNTRETRQFFVDVVDEQIDAISQGMLGLTVACARCHDHKFDPIPTEDYYALAGILGSSRTHFGTYEGPGVLRTSDLIALPAAADLGPGPEMPEILRRFYERRESTLDRQLDEAMESMGSMEESADERQVRRRQRLQRTGRAMIEDLLARFDEDGRERPDERYAMGASEGMGRDLRVLRRGEPSEPGPFVARGFPQVLTGGGPVPIEEGSGRLELARWIASPENPLTARVWVNRVWSHLFGAGLVPSADNFGTTGHPPTHPELLDWLASTFVEEDGWSTKALVRRLVLSRAYRLEADGDPRNERVDPEARLLWRMPARRLEAEAIRDAMLFTAGTLELERPAGSPLAAFEGQLRNEALLERLTEELACRSVYLPVLRDRVPPALECFDAADPSFVTGDREVTVAASQALHLMNDEQVMRTADSFARRLLREERRDEDRIRRAFLLTLSREPSSREVAIVKGFLREFTAIAERDDELGRRSGAAWSAFVQSLFQSAEFRYRG